MDSRSVISTRVERQSHTPVDSPPSAYRSSYISPSHRKMNGDVQNPNTQPRNLQPLIPMRIPLYQPRDQPKHAQPHSLGVREDGPFVEGPVRYDVGPGGEVG